ncbi:MAG: sugar transferase [Hymenobacteraceae bacterium]|nr:sugar transferase [Hymenobacteraceae bacterium]
MPGYLLKRPLDLVLTALALPVALPLLAGAMLALRLAQPGPVLFRQPRVGWGGRRFTFYKLRTMTDARDPLSGALLPDAARLTGVGQFLRKTSLDELPQLWHVLTGEMSLVGPRPLLPAYLPRYSARQAERHRVRPGITGWAQVNGRNALAWPARLELDAWYAEHVSLRLDLRILFLTVARVLRPRGISAPGEATMPEFRGETE